MVSNVIIWPSLENDKIYHPVTMAAWLAAAAEGIERVSERRVKVPAGQ
jgi:hypothetical protein